MEVITRASIGLVAIVALIFAMAFPSATLAQSMAPAAAPTSNGTTIDQVMAYALMLLALALTYLIH